MLDYKRLNDLFNYQRHLDVIYLEAPLSVPSLVAPAYQLVERATADHPDNRMYLEIIIHVRDIL